MTTSAVSILQRVVDLAQDATNVRWTAAELVRWLNDGQRQILVYRPDLFATPTVINLVAGTRQNLPATAAKLIDIVNNNTGTKSAVRQVERGPLDEFNPDWHSDTPSTTVKQYMYDMRDPRAFYVYPPAAVGASVNAICANYPVDIAEPSAGASYTTVTGNITPGDIAAAALVDYMLYRMYSKDIEAAGNVALATGHYSAFAELLNIEVKATGVVAPGANAAGQPAPTA